MGGYCWGGLGGGSWVLSERWISLGLIEEWRNGTFIDIEGREKDGFDHDV